MLRALWSPFEVVLVTNNEKEDGITARTFLSQNGIRNVQIKSISFNDSNREQLRGKRVLSIYTPGGSAYELAITPHSRLKAKCDKAGAVFLLYVKPQTDQQSRNDKKFKGCLYGVDDAFQKWAKITTSFTTLVRPMCVIAAVAIIAGIFASKRGYFSNLFTSQSWLKLN